MKRKNIILLVHFITLTGIILWLSAIFLAPYLTFRGLKSNNLIYFCYSSICHQIPSRSFFIFGYPLAVCARCLGIYIGFFTGTVLYPIFRGFSDLRLPKIKIFIFISLPIVLDTFGNFFHIWRTTNQLRSVIGFLWGIPLPFYFITGMAEFFLSLRGKNFSSRQICNSPGKTIE